MPDKTKIMSQGELIQKKSIPDPWYGNNIFSVYKFEGNYYRIFYNDADPKGPMSNWTKVEKVEPVPQHTVTFVKV